MQCNAVPKCLRVETVLMREHRDCIMYTLEEYSASLLLKSNNRGDDNMAWPICD